MKKAGKVAMWLVVTGTVLSCTYKGLYQGDARSLNFAQFMVWLNIVTVTFVALSKETAQKLKEKGRTLPVGLVVVTDAAVVYMFATFGHFVTAGFYVWHMVCEASIYSKEDA